MYKVVEVNSLATKLLPNCTTRVNHSSRTSVRAIQSLEPAHRLYACQVFEADLSKVLANHRSFACDSK